MPHRDASPAFSEGGFDIAGALLADEHNDERKQEIPLVGLEEEDDSDEDFIAGKQAAANRKAPSLKNIKKGGGFQSMGLNPKLLKAIDQKGFRIPTPIQRKTIPLVMDGRDVVGMARTGSGKTAAFVIPMIERLKTHNTRVGTRALILSPSRELALQTLKVVKEFGRGTDLRCVLLVGGDSMEAQFASVAANPDIVIATPGRFVHLQVEMKWDLSEIRYVVFDEADRLFEMGFAPQLTEILHSLPTSRQTLLFSATLPKSLVEFARAGLQEPKLVRLDAESKISPDLQSAFFSVKNADKEGALLHILHDIIKIPTGKTDAAIKKEEERSQPSKKRKRSAEENSNPKDSPSKYSTIVFTATKHHVDYITSILRASGFAVSYVYGALDQTARKMQVQDFRAGMTNILVVTDVAARGIDIPILANVINYDFPSQPKVFVHRVGRTARAGQKGWSYSLIRNSDVPYLLDLQLFLGKRLLIGRTSETTPDYTQDVALGGLVRDEIARHSEWATKLLEEDPEISLQRTVAGKGEKLYLRTRNSASGESAKRSKEVTASNHWMELHPLFEDNAHSQEFAREQMLARVSSYRPLETVFEIGKRGTRDETGEVVRKRREKIQAKRRSIEQMDAETNLVNDPGLKDTSDASPAEVNLEDDSDEEVDVSNYPDMDSADEDEIEVTFSNNGQGAKKRKKSTIQDSEHFMSYKPIATNAHEDRGYGVHSGSYSTSHSGPSSFLQDANSATMDLANDEGSKAFAQPSRPAGKRWDKKRKDYVSIANDEDGSKGVKMVKSESGGKIAASFRSGRFDAWRKSNRVDRLPRVGEVEGKSASMGGFGGGRRFKHHSQKAPKEADKYRDDYYKKKKQVDAAKEKRIGKFKAGSGKNELKGANDVWKERAEKAKKKEKTARPSKRR